LHLPIFNTQETSRPSSRQKTEVSKVAAAQQEAGNAMSSTAKGRRYGAANIGQNLHFFLFAL
jgi:hypothetical protein